MSERWDLTPILPSLEEHDTRPAFDALEAAVRKVEGYRDRLETLSAAELADALHALGEVKESAKRLTYRGMLAFSEDTTDDGARTFLEQAEAAGTDAANRTRFLTHWLKEMPDERVRAILPEDPDLAHFVEKLRRSRPYMLPEHVERVIADKDLTGVSAVQQAQEILTSSLTFRDPKTGETTTQSQLLTYIHKDDAELRRSAYQTLLDVYETHESVLSHLYRSVVRDWNTEHLGHRGYPDRPTPMNLANEVSDDVVRTMLGVCVERRGVWQEYFGWKGRRLGYPLTRYDIYAPVEADAVSLPYHEAADLVLSIFSGFSEDYGRLAKRVFDESHVDALPRPNKRGGAFSATVQSRMTPYVLLNHTDDARSVSTMAHELGHAVHSLLAADRHPLVSHATLPLAETASIFSELLLHHSLVQRYPDSAAGLLSDRLAELYATIQRQAYFARFEEVAHDLVMRGRPTSEIHERYYGLLQEQFGEMEIPPMFQKEWLVVPHFVQAPFYVSSYTFGALLALSLYQRYREDSGFAGTILQILSAGGSRDPQALLADHGLDIGSADFWHRGMDVVESLVHDLPSAT